MPDLRVRRGVLTVLVRRVLGDLLGDGILGVSLLGSAFVSGDLVAVGPRPETWWAAPSASTLGARVALGVALVVGAGFLALGALEALFLVGEVVFVVRAVVLERRRVLAPPDVLLVPEAGFEGLPPGLTSLTTAVYLPFSKGP